MSEHVNNFGCACCSPNLIPTFTDDAREWPELIKILALPKPAETVESVIFHGGNIYPDPTQTDFQVEAIGIADHQVVATGTLEHVREEMLKRNGDFRLQMLTDNQTLLPGLIEPHAHLLTSAIVGSWTNLSPFGDDQKLRSSYGMSFIYEQLASAVDSITKDAGANDVPKWVCGFGVDPSLMDVWGEINAEWLNKISPDVCIFLLNASGHISYVNGAALSEAGLDKNYNNGVLTESESTKVTSKIPPPTKEETVLGLLRVFADANRRGITTIFDAGLGMLNKEAEVDLMRFLATTAGMTVRVGAALYVGSDSSLPDWVKQFHPEQNDDANALFGLRAVKLMADGSNQGLTGFQSQNYLCCLDHTVPGVGPRGLFNFSPPWGLAQIMRTVADAGWPILVHANGDEGIANVLAAFQLALDKAGPLLPNPVDSELHSGTLDLRHRIEHASLLHDDAIVTMKRLGVSPSFLIGHVGYWGRTLQRTILGPARAQLLDRCASALAAGLKISLHSDHFVSPLGPLRCMEQAIGRVMEGPRSILGASEKAGRTSAIVMPEDSAEIAGTEDVLNPAERLTASQALRAVTIDAAWQCHLDEHIGSLRPGKQADLVILEDDPLQWTAENAEGMRDITVSETWVSGRCVYSPGS
ncbi:amidohydrolase [Robbsia andropogonis]|uniref:amidohydrolase n=1 Tax=Robbsia andropogonis TaxID=28092 RepID=UPI00209EA6B4|nr:amidohydrolase family protein [Robbsia andropogonis]MCP1118010.1 amidohydrolase [Robbsia andropogonis]MCP1127709.1 amidohydrolase [Robbsia andropogonis]